MIEKVSGKPYGQALDEMILKPLGMTRSAYDAPEKLIARKAAGYVRVLGKYQPAPPLWIPNIASGGGMVSTVGDFLKWDQALYGEKLLSAESKRLMFTPYVKDDVWGDLGYGYGWMIGKRDIADKPRLVHEHGGNANGYRSLITRYPDEQRLVVILLNEGNGNKGPGIYQIKDGITKILYGQTAMMPTATLADALVAAIDKDGVAATLERFELLRASAHAVTRPDELNMLGYAYANAARFDAALAVFKLNLRMFPKDGNTYDSMGEINLMQGDKTSARVNYKRALELDPANSNAADVLRKLGVD